MIWICFCGGSKGGVPTMWVEAHECRGSTRVALRPGPSPTKLCFVELAFLFLIRAAAPVFLQRVRQPTKHRVRE